MENNNYSQAQNIMDITIRLGLLLLIIAWCIVLLLPFASVIVWGIILALAAYPLFNVLSKKFGGRSKLAAAAIVLMGLLLIAIPAWLFLDSVIAGVSTIRDSFESNNITLAVPNEKIASWPLIGEKLYAFWLDASKNIEATLTKYSSQLIKIGNRFFEQLLGISGSILQMIVATIIAGVLLLAKGTEETSKAFFRKVAGTRGDEFLAVTQKTVNNVVKGVFGVALIQSTLVGVGFILAGVPYAGLWTLLVLILAILQMPAILVVLPVVLYLFSEMNVGPAILWTIYLLLAGAADNILKPILLGKGAPVPMLVIFLGVLGGFITSGFLGLFTGAIVLSIGYKLFISWLDTAHQEKSVTKD
ncbi:MAG TPA: AI-2E family transporter [Bacteroidales bacterium]|jgi:predicted PurR-regulated permease PerM|nr:AI-2E family transporter [Bacteroidales bacterium]